jgi:hypothetical protein
MQLKRRLAILRGEAVGLILGRGAVEMAGAKVLIERAIAQHMAGGGEGSTRRPRRLPSWVRAGGGAVGTGIADG